MRRNRMGKREQRRRAGRGLLSTQSSSPEGRLALLALSLALALFACGGGDGESEEPTTAPTTASTSTTSSTTTSTTTTVPTTVPRTRATTPPATQPQLYEQSEGGCSSAYPDFCIAPPPPDLDCADVSGRRFTVRPPDPHRFDADADGLGCER